MERLPGSFSSSFKISSTIFWIASIEFVSDTDSEDEDDKDEDSYDDSDDECDSEEEELDSLDEDVSEVLDEDSSTEKLPLASNSTYSGLSRILSRSFI